MHYCTPVGGFYSPQICTTSTDYLNIKRLVVHIALKHKHITSERMIQYFPACC